jgi:hypothetical protein
MPNTYDDNSGSGDIILFRITTDVLSSTPILTTIDALDRPNMKLVITDDSGHAIAAILRQPGGESPENSRLSDWHPVTFYSQKLTEIERRYKVVRYKIKSA